MFIACSLFNVFFVHILMRLQLYLFENTWEVWLEEEGQEAEMALSRLLLVGGSKVGTAGQG